MPRFVHRALRALTFVWALSLLAVAADADNRVLQYAEMARITTHKDVISTLERLRETRATDELLGACAPMATSGQPPRPGNEYVLVQCAIMLSTRPLTNSSHQWLNALAKRPVWFHVAHEHAGHRTDIPAFDPGAAARFALTKHISASQRRPDARSIADVRRALPADPSLSQRLLDHARRADDASVLFDILVHGDAQAQADAIIVATALNNTHDGHELLLAAVELPDVRDRAVLAIAAIARRDPAKADTLLRLLDEPGTAYSAAAALGRLGRPDLVQRLAVELDVMTTRRSAAARVLAIHLSGDARALSMLSDWAQRDGPWAELRSEVMASYFGETTR
ncbi:MAG: hypothetical protein AAF610_12440 [Pseudomonadota bacterium]